MKWVDLILAIVFLVTGFHALFTSDNEALFPACIALANTFFIFFRLDHEKEKRNVRS